MRRYLLFALTLLGVSLSLVALQAASNALPHRMLLDRFDFESRWHLRHNASDPGKVSGFKYNWEFCEFSAAVLVGTAPHDRRHVVRDALLPLEPSRMRPDGVIRGDHCAQVFALQEGNWNGELWLLKLQYLWGVKPAYAFSLALMGHDALYRATWALTAVLLVALAGAICLVGGVRARLALLPVVVFAVATAGNYYWSDVANGIPYVFALAALLGAALLLGSARWRRLAPGYAFAVGCVSAHLWLNDGHNYLLAAMLPALAYFLVEGADRAARFRRAAAQLIAYCAGFFGTYALMLLVKMAAFGIWFGDFGAPLGGVLLVGRKRFVQAAYGEPIGVDGPQLDRFPFFRDLPVWWDMSFLPIPLMLGLTLLTIGAAVLTLALLSRRRPLPVAAWDVMAGLGAAALAATATIIDDDQPYRSARYLFLWHGLLWGAVLVGVSVLLDGAAGTRVRMVMDRIAKETSGAGGFFARARPLRAGLVMGAIILLAIGALAVPLLRGPEDNPRYRPVPPKPASQVAGTSLPTAVIAPVLR